VSGSFERALRSMKLFQIYKRRMRSEKPLVVFNTVLCSLNYRRLKKIIHLGELLDIDSITFMAVMEPAPLERDIKLNDEQRNELRRLLPGAIEYSRRVGVDTNLDEFLSSPELTDARYSTDRLIMEERARFLEGTVCDTGKNRHVSEEVMRFIGQPCFEPYYNIIVRADGETVPCCIIQSSPENIKMRGLREIWEGEFFTLVRERLKAGELLPDCARCLSTLVIKNRRERELLYKRLKNGYVFMGRYD